MDWPFVRPVEALERLVVTGRSWGALGVPVSLVESGFLTLGPPLLG